MLKTGQTFKDDTPCEPSKTCISTLMTIYIPFVSEYLPREHKMYYSIQLFTEKVYLMFTFESRSLRQKKSITKCMFEELFLARSSFSELSKVHVLQMFPSTMSM